MLIWQRTTCTVKHVIAHAQGELLNKTGILHELLDQVRYVKDHIKVEVFWEGHKIWRILHFGFDIT